jgi:hypothetical protein
MLLIAPSAASDERDTAQLNRNYAVAQKTGDMPFGDGLLPKILTIPPESPAKLPKLSVGHVTSPVTHVGVNAAFFACSLGGAGTNGRGGRYS